MKTFIYDLIYYLFRLRLELIADYGGISVLQSSSPFSCNLAISWEKNMNGIKRKILGIFVCMLVLATIPLAAGTTETEPAPEPELDTSRV